MKFFAFSVTALVFLALGVIASACGDDGGGGLSLAEYFQQLDAIQNQADERFAAQEAGPEPAPDASEEELADFLREGVQELVTTLRDFADAAEELDPPDEVEELHNDLVDAVEGGADAAQAVVDDLPDRLSFSESELEQLVARFRPELDAALISIEEACSALQAVADDNSIDVDLECEGAEEEG